MLECCMKKKGLRPSCLPPGWFPNSSRGIENFLLPFAGNASPGIKVVMAPHAGWYYSGNLAALAISHLDSSAETVAILGGHLGNTPILMADEDAVRIPDGEILMDMELGTYFKEKLKTKLNLDIKPDIYQDNTVEVLLPMMKYFFPDAKLLWLRMPSIMSSYEAGILLKESSEELGINLSCIASADLTHYGSNYGFSPKGSGKAAFDWVRYVNDHAFLEALIKGDPANILKRGLEDHSCCSIGTVIAAQGFSGDKKAKLLKYSTSVREEDNDRIPDSFVGYAAMLWE